MKNLFLLLLTICFSLLSYGQTPKTISYQGVARNATGQSIPNQPIKIRLSLLETATSSNPLYTETHTLTTTSQGLFALQIGAGTVLSGIYANLDWSNGPKFVKTEIDPAGGDNFTISSTNPLNAVPFALFAQNGDRDVTLTGQGATTITGTYPNFVIRSKDSVGTYQAGTGMDLNGNTFAGKVNDPLWNANKLQGRTVDPATPANKDVLKWNGTSWKTGKDSVNTYSAGTGINITPGLNISAKNDDAIWNASKMQGKNISTIQPSIEDFLRYDGSKWVPGKSIPTFTTKQRDSIPTTTIPTGFTFYNNNTECLEYYTGNKWLALCGIESNVGDTLSPTDLSVSGQIIQRKSFGDNLILGRLFTHKNKIYLVGRLNAQCGQGPINTFLSYDINTGLVTNLPLNPFGSTSEQSCSFVHGNKYYSIEHLSGTSILTIISIFDVTTNSWSKIDLAYVPQNYPGRAPGGGFLVGNKYIGCLRTFNFPLNYNSVYFEYNIGSDTIKEKYISYTGSYPNQPMYVSEGIEVEEGKVLVTNNFGEYMIYDHMTSGFTTFYSNSNKLLGKPLGMINKKVIIPDKENFKVEYNPKSRTFERFSTILPDLSENNGIFLANRYFYITTEGSPTCKSFLFEMKL